MVKTPFRKEFQGFLVIFSQLFLHGRLNHADKTIPAFIALFRQLFYVLANGVEAVMDTSGMLSGKLRHVRSIPDDVILANGLEPKRLNTYRTLTNLAVPEKESRGKGLSLDFGPTRGINQEDKHILFPAVQPGSRPHTFLRRLKIHCEFVHGVEEVRVIEAGICGPMNGAKVISLGEKLKRLGPTGEGIHEDVYSRFRAHLVDCARAHLRDLTQLGKAPVVQAMIAVLSQRQRGTVVADVNSNITGRMPLLGGIFFLLMAVVVKGFEVRENLVWRSFE